MRVQLCISTRERKREEKLSWALVEEKKRCVRRESNPGRKLGRLAGCRCPTNAWWKEEVQKNSFVWRKWLSSHSRGGAAEQEIFLCDGMAEWSKARVRLCSESAWLRIPLSSLFFVSDITTMHAGASLRMYLDGQTDRIAPAGFGREKGEKWGPALARNSTRHAKPLHGYC